MALASYFAEVLDAEGEEDGESGAVLRLALNSLYALAKGLYSPGDIKAAFELRYMALSGYALGCCGGAPSLRAVFPDLPLRGATCATAGVMGPVVGMIGALQAQMALAVLLGLEPSPLGRLVSMDAASWRMGGFRFDRAPEPDAPLPFIAASQIAPGDLLVDLRAESAPFRPDARHLPPERITRLDPPEGARVVLACRTGLRAHNAGRDLQSIWPGRIALLALND